MAQDRKRKRSTRNRGSLSIDPLHDAIDIYGQSLTQDIWRDKYRWGDEVDPKETSRRVVEGVYQDDPSEGAKWLALEAMEKALWIPGGRIWATAGTNKVTTMLNCLSGDTQLLTREYGTVNIGDYVNRDLHVVTESGWQKASIQAFGMQQLNKISFKSDARANLTHIIRATANHRWPLSNNIVTDALKVFHRVKAMGLTPSKDTPAYAEGWIHGFTFGDGTLRRTTKRDVGMYDVGMHHFIIRLCGAKTEYLDRFNTDHITYPPVQNGEPCVYLHSYTNYKELPCVEECSTDYIKGFIEGWYDADGHKSDPRQLAISTSSIDAVEWFIKNAPLGGYVCFSHCIARKAGTKTNLGTLKNDLHLIKFKVVDKIEWIVQDIEPDTYEKVFCAIVPDAHAFTLAGGIYTGNCFVSCVIDDSMIGIMDALKDAALTQQQGGGIGMDFSTLRPQGALLERTQTTASGPLYFMDMWDAMCGTIKSAGDRRGAMMATMHCEHPDLPAFITAKRQKGRLTNFNVSVLITDAFMDAVKHDEVWYLGSNQPRMDGNHILEMIREDPPFEGKWYGYSKHRARDLWDSIIENTYDWAEPGVIFIDRVNDTNPLQYIEDIQCTNPCVASGTLVSTPTGLRPVEEINVDDYITTIAGAKQVTSIEVHQDISVFKVTFKTGQTLRVTAAHIFHVWDRSKEMRKRTRSPTWAREYEVWKKSGKAWSSEKRLSELQLGDIIRLAPGITPLNEVPNAFGWAQKDYGFLMGVLLGDGTYTEKGTYIKIAVGTKEPEWIDVIRDTLRRMGERGTLRLDKCISRGSSATLLLSQEFANKIRATPLERNLSYNKSIPLEFINSNADFLWGMLDGLICTDGVVNKHQLGGIVKLTTSSPKLADDFQRICHLLGMNARIYRSKRKGNKVTIVGNDVICKRDMYEVCLMGEHFHKVNNSITLSHPRKAATLKTWAKTFDAQGDRYQTEIVSIEPDGVTDVYDLYEATTDTWITDGIVSRGCGEQPLPPYGCCNLGAVNLARMVKHPFTNQASFDFTLLKRIVVIGIRFLDNVIDVSIYPLPEQQKEEYDKRRIGLGITGLANALAQLRLPYGESQSLTTIDKIMSTIKVAAYQASADLAKERGPFPAFTPEWGQDSPVVKSLPPRIRKKIYDEDGSGGIRNGVLLTIAPTGTTSILSGNISSGIEPVFAYQMERKVRQGNTNADFKPYIVFDYGYLLYRVKFPAEENMPHYMVEHHEVTPINHIHVQSVCQKHIDSSISKTINFSEDVTLESFKDIYNEAYARGCKGCTTYRPSDVRGAVLAAVSGGKNTKQLQPIVLVKRPSVVAGKTYKKKAPGTAGATIYVTINDVDGRPVEIFIHSTSSIYADWQTALALMISAIMRRGDDISFVPEELKKVASAHESGFVGGKHYKSLVSLIGTIIEEHLKASDMSALKVSTEEQPIESNEPKVTGEICPKCLAPTYTSSEGCMSCSSCGHSSCG